MKSGYEFFFSGSNHRPAITYENEWAHRLWVAESHLEVVLDELRELRQEKQERGQQ